MNRYFPLSPPKTHDISASEGAVDQKLVVNSITHPFRSLFYSPKCSFLLPSCDTFPSELSSLFLEKHKLSISLNHIIYKITHKNVA